MQDENQHKMMTLMRLMSYEEQKEQDKAFQGSKTYQSPSKVGVLNSPSQTSLDAPKDMPSMKERLSGDRFFQRHDNFKSSFVESIRNSTENEGMQTTISSVGSRIVKLPREETDAMSKRNRNRSVERERRHRGYVYAQMQYLRGQAVPMVGSAEGSAQRASSPQQKAASLTQLQQPHHDLLQGLNADERYAVLELVESYKYIQKYGGRPKFDFEDDGDDKAGPRHHGRGPLPPIKDKAVSSREYSTSIQSKYNTDARVGSRPNETASKTKNATSEANKAGKERSPERRKEGHDMRGEDDRDYQNHQPEVAAGGGYRGSKWRRRRVKESDGPYAAMAPNTLSTQTGAADMDESPDAVNAVKKTKRVKPPTGPGKVALSLSTKPAEPAFPMLY